MGRKSVLRVLKWRKKMFEEIAVKANQAILEDLEMGNVSGSILKKVQEFAKGVNDEVLDGIEDTLVAIRNERPNDPVDKRTPEEEKMLLRIKSGFATPDRLRRRACEMILGQVQGEMLERKYEALSKEEKAQYDKQNRKPGLDFVELSIKDEMRAAFFKAIVRPQKPVEEVKLDADEWEFLKPHWADDKGKDTWNGNSLSAALVLTIKEEVFDKVEEVDAKL